MGYTTDFSGCLTITPPLSPEQASYIQAFNGTRRMKRSAAVAETLDDDKRKAVGLPIGVEGGYFVGGGGFRGQGDDASVMDHNSSPSGQPGLWCQWTVDDEGTELTWDEGEKFYNYEEWLEYLVEHFFKPWGCELEGKIDWAGEDSNDRGTIYAKGFMIEAISDSITNDGPSWNCHKPVTPTPEVTMSNERIWLTKDQALSMLGEGETIHTFRTPGIGLMVGCDWSRQNIISAIEDEDNDCELGGPMCQRMNHGLIIHIDGPLFVECSNDFDYAAFELALTAPQETKAAGDE